METADTAGICAVGGDATRTVGAEGTGEVDARGSHSTAPNWELAQTRGMGRARDRARSHKERWWVHMSGEGCWRFAGRAKGAKVEEEERANGWPGETLQGLAARCGA